MSDRPVSERHQVKGDRRLAIMGGSEIEQKRSRREAATSALSRDFSRDGIRGRLLKK
jgi:hypothetical protein